MAPFSSESRTLEPFAKGPSTRGIRRNDGTIDRFVMAARYVTPMRARSADTIAAFTALGLSLAGAIAALSVSNGNPLIAAVAFIWPWLAMPPIRRIHRHLLGQTVRIEITRDRLRVCGSWGWQAYDRRLPHRFVLLQHDKAAREQLLNDFKIREAQLRQRAVSPPRYYQDSWHVIFESVGQRIDLATVFGLKSARAMQARLEGCCQVLDGQFGTGEGVARNPEDEWHRGPGDIPAGR